MDYEVSTFPSENSTFSNGSISCQFYTNSTTWFWDLIDAKVCWKHNTLITFLFVALYSLIFLLGWVGNSSVIWVILSNPKMWRGTTFFLLSLAVADILVIMFCVPVTLLTNLFTPWVLGEFMCKAVPYIQGVSVFSSAYSLVAISIDRCWAIRHSKGLPRGLSKSQALAFIIFIWISAIVITIPWWFVFQLVLRPGPLPFCHEAWSNPASDRIYFLSVHFLLCFTIPIILICILNGIVWHNVSSRPIIPVNSSSSTTLNSVYLLHRTTKVRVLKMLSIMTLAFFLSWLPLYVVMTKLKFFGLPNKTESAVGHYLFQVLIPIVQLLGSANSCLNPILYTFVNKNFRLTLQSLVSVCFARFSKPSPNQGQITLVSVNNRNVNRSRRTAANGHHQVVVEASQRISTGKWYTSSFYSANTVQTHTQQKCVCTNL